MQNTALIVEPRVLEKTDYIINVFKERLGPNWKIVFYCGKGTAEHWATTDLDKSVELRELEVTNYPTSYNYSTFFKSKELWENLYGDYVLTFQLDCWIFNEEPYTVDYFIDLKKSYIGGNQDFHWVELQRDGVIYPNTNFNGGLSLRNRANMLAIIDAFPAHETMEYTASPSLETDAEDVYFTLGSTKLEFPVGDDIASSYFAMHRIFKDRCFGIHQPAESIREQINELHPDLKEKNPYLRL
jgi:hypothetical protein